MAAVNQKIPIICGPTASGKTSLALSLSKKYDIEIISADSRQIIKHLNIGTAKPTEEELASTKFHLVDIIEPGERYSAFQFIDDSQKAIGNILKRDKIPLLVGGTGLYLYALTEGVVEIDSDDFEIRERLETELAEKGGEFMHDKLSAIDPLEAAKIHPNNHQRLIRALEIFHLTGKSKSELLTTGAYKKSDYEFEYFCLLPDREELYQKINQRVEVMIDDGLLEEINHLIEKGYKDKIEKANVIGYSELIEYLNGKTTLEEAISMIKQNSRRYAKRQYTWFRKQLSDRIFKNREELYQEIEQNLSRY